MSQKSKEDVSSYFDHVISTIASTVSREGSLDSAFMGVGPSLDWGLLNPEEDKNICSDNGRCIRPFYEYTFSILSLCFPYNNFKIEV